MLTDEELQKIRECCEKATPGPWEYGEGPNYPVGTIYQKEHAHLATLWGSDPIAYSNSEFIAASRTDIPALLDTIAVYKKALELAGVEIAQLNVRGAYVTITDKVMPEYWLKQAEAEINA